MNQVTENPNPADPNKSLLSKPQGEKGKCPACDRTVARWLEDRGIWIYQLRGIHYSPVDGTMYGKCRYCKAILGFRAEVWSPPTTNS